MKPWRRTSSVRTPATAAGTIVTTATINGMNQLVIGFNVPVTWDGVTPVTVSTPHGGGTVSAQLDPTHIVCDPDCGTIWTSGDSASWAAPPTGLSPEPAPAQVWTIT